MFASRVCEGGWMGLGGSSAVKHMHTKLHTRLHPPPQVPEGVDLALMKMKQGERALVTISDAK